MLRSLISRRSTSVALQSRKISFAAASAKDGLTSEHIDFFHANGYLHLRGFLQPEECETLMQRAKHHVNQCDVKEHRSIFTTSEQARKMNDVYFLESGDKIRYFFEEHAFEEDKQTLRVPLEFAINKIGHNLHNLDPAFEKVSYSPSVKAIVKSLGYVRPMAVQSMYIFKQPSIGGEVSAHQDGTFLYTEPQSVTGLWWALEDCSTDNGCLYGVPGSHKDGVRQRFRRTRKEDQEKHGSLLETVPEKVEPFDISNSVPVETKKGDLVLLHNAFVHYSNANRSPRSRHAYTVHVVESHNVHYPAENWLQNTDFTPFKPMYEP